MPARKFLRHALSLLALVAPLAHGHAVLLESEPAAQAVLDDSPTEIRLGFNENVGPIFVRLLDISGVETGAPDDFRVDGNDVYLPLTETLDNGTYVVTYRVISADTHPVGGSFVFAVGEAVADTGALTDSAAAVSGWRLPVAINRFALYVGGALALGSALVLLLLALPDESRSVTGRQGRIAALVSAVALLLGIGLGGAEMLAGGTGALLSSGAWATGAGSTLGSSALIGVPGALLIWWAFKSDSPPVWALAGGALLLGGSFLVTGHAATAPPAWAMALVVGLHLAAIAFWFAALGPLAKTVELADSEVAADVLERFSGRAMVAVTVMLVSGLAITWVQVRSVEALWSTDYGIRLVAKLALVIVVLGIAIVNKSRLTARLRTQAGAAAALRRNIRLEFLLMLLIMAVAVSLTLPSPPRALAASGAAADASGGTTLTASKGELTVTIEVTPARPGENMLMIAFTDANGQIVPVENVTVIFALPAASLDGIEKKAEAVAPGRYHLMVNELIIPGDWELRIDAFVDDFDKRIFRTTLPLR